IARSQSKSLLYFFPVQFATANEQVRSNIRSLLDSCFNFWAKSLRVFLPLLSLAARLLFLCAADRCFDIGAVPFLHKALDVGEGFAIKAEAIGLEIVEFLDGELRADGRRDTSCATSNFARGDFLKQLIGGWSAPKDRPNPLHHPAEESGDFVEDFPDRRDFSAVNVSVPRPFTERLGDGFFRFEIVTGGKVTPTLIDVVSIMPAFTIGGVAQRVPFPRRDQALIAEPMDGFMPREWN